MVDSMRFLMKLAKEKNPEVSDIVDIFVYLKCNFPESVTSLRTLISVGWSADRVIGWSVNISSKGSEVVIPMLISDHLFFDAKLHRKRVLFYNTVHIFRRFLHSYLCCIERTSAARRESRSAS